MLTTGMRKTLEEIGLGEQWRQQGFEEGIEKGMEKGIEEGRLKTARAMIAEGDSLAKIARVTEIPVKTLKKKLSIQ